MTIRSAYEDSLLREGHVRDPAQLEVISNLEALQDQILSGQSKPNGMFRWAKRNRAKQQPDIKGLYIWGGVGRGKTFLMDLFFESLDYENKKRVHFHRMMHDVHARLGALDDIEDPLDTVAADIATDTRVLCFDEFFVSDIGDAMILGRLLDGLFRRGVILITTSNSSPGDLYKDGLQRQRFLAAIELLNLRTDVIHMGGDTDYRLRLLQKAGTWLTPNDERAATGLKYFFDEAASSEIREDTTLDVNGRDIQIRRCGVSIAWFDFHAICDGPRSQADYIEIARCYPSVIVSGVPQLDSAREDQARRFIAVVDEFYDRRVKLIVSADCDPDSIYSGTRLSFEFNRTLSRLIEMQSTEYLALPHLA